MRVTVRAPVVVAIAASMALVSAGCSRAKPSAIEAAARDLFQSARGSGGDIEIEAYGLRSQIAAAQAKAAQEQTVSIVNAWWDYAGEHVGEVFDVACVLKDANFAELSMEKSGLDLPGTQHLFGVDRTRAEDIGAQMSTQQQAGQAGLAAVKVACDLTDAASGL